MKRIFLLLAVATAAACTPNSGNDAATSTPIDSTKATGAAPVQYGNNNPANDSIANTGVGENVIQHNDGMANRRTQNGMAGDYSGEQKSPAPGRAAGTGQNVSNTTDPATTSGSRPGTGAPQR